MMTNTAKATESLTDLPFEQLKRVMFARLHGEQSFGPITDPRVGLEPFEWLVEQFQRGDTGLRDRMTAVMGEFLNELADLEAWPAPARSNLLDVLQDCGDALVDDIRRLIRIQTLLKLAGAGAPAHAGLLKCLISLEHRETPEFWMEQFNLLGPEYGALIFSGLLDHGLDVAVRRLPHLCRHDHALQQIRLLLPVLQDEFGTERVLRTFQSQFERLPKTTCAVFVADLKVDEPEEVAETEPKLVFVGSDYHSWYKRAGSFGSRDRDSAEASTTSRDREVHDQPYGADEG